eukprot:6418957-Alexandrium_andersonii.AAC.1
MGELGAGGAQEDVSAMHQRGRRRCRQLTPARCATRTARLRSKPDRRGGSAPLGSLRGNPPRNRSAARQRRQGRSPAR